MFPPFRLRDFLIVSLAFCFVVLLLHISEKAYLLWFLSIIPIFLAGWVWQMSGAFIIAILVITSTSILVYLEVISNKVPINSTDLLIQTIFGLTIIFLGGLGVGKISDVAAKEKKLIEQITLKDSITGLYTKKYFNLRLEDEIKRSERFNMPFTLLSIGIDSFQEFRDTFGYFRTEILQKKVAKLIERCLRDIDVAARYDNGFVLILPGSVIDEGIMIAERIRQSIEKSEFEGDEVDPVVKRTLSIGLAHFPEDIVKENNILNLALEAQNIAEKNGGNKVTQTTLNII